MIANPIRGNTGHVEIDKIVRHHQAVVIACHAGFGQTQPPSTMKFWDVHMRDWSEAR